jgi:hypothetical protein
MPAVTKHRDLDHRQTQRVAVIEGDRWNLAISIHGAPSGLREVQDDRAVAIKHSDAKASGSCFVIVNTVPIAPSNIGRYASSVSRKTRKHRSGNLNEQPETRRLNQIVGRTEPEWANGWNGYRNARIYNAARGSRFDGDDCSIFVIRRARVHMRLNTSGSANRALKRSLSNTGTAKSSCTLRSV